MYRVIKRGVVLSERRSERASFGLQKSLLDDIINAIDDFEPGMRSYSTRRRNWIAELDLRTCLRCRNLHGKIFDADEMIYEEPPLHDRCRCRIEQLAAVFPGCATRNGHLPSVEGRVWYEADINYTKGYRTRHRVLYSNDGLVFVTYDHYETFWGVV